MTTRLCGSVWSFRRPSLFSAETQAAIAAIEFSKAVKIGFQARRRFWEEDHGIYGGISWTDQDITQVWYPPYGYQRTKGIIMGAFFAPSS